MSPGSYSTCPLYIVFQILKVYISYKNLQDTATSYFISYCFTLVFTSADLIFHNAKKDFCLEFYFLNRFTWISPTPLTAKICQAWLKVFVNASYKRRQLCMTFQSPTKYAKGVLQIQLTICGANFSNNISICQIRVNIKIL